MSKAVSPEDFENRMLAVFACLPAVGVYLFRAMGDEPIGGAGKGLFFLLMGTFPLICIVIFLAGGLVLWILYHSATKSLMPLLFLLGSLFIAMVLPVPAGPAEKNFYEHRLHYEAIVALARQNKLEHGNCGNAFRVPLEFQDGIDECVSVNHEPALAVEFLLHGSYHTLAYVESPEALEETLFCGLHGGVFKKLEERWYLCTSSE